MNGSESRIIAVGNGNQLSVGSYDSLFVVGNLNNTYCTPSKVFHQDVVLNDENVVNEMTVIAVEESQVIQLSQSSMVSSFFVLHPKTNDKRILNSRVVKEVESWVELKGQLDILFGKAQQFSLEIEYTKEHIVQIGSQSELDFYCMTVINCISSELHVILSSSEPVDEPGQHL